MFSKRSIFLVLLLAVSGLAGWFFLGPGTLRDMTTSTPATRGGAREARRKVVELIERERKVAESIWARELLAQRCGRTIEAWWDAINAATNKLRAAASFQAGEVVLAEWKTPQGLPHEIEMRDPAGSGRTLSAEQWPGFLAEFERAGWQLVQVEFRHSRFETDEAGQPRQSQFYFSAHLTNPQHAERAILEGALLVDWGANDPKAESVSVKRADASRLTLKTRHGEPPFRPVFTEIIQPPDKSHYIDPLIVYDLDGDGFLEIILAARNLVYRRAGGDRYESSPLCRHSPGLLSTALIADFDEDGAPDFLCAKAQGLFLFKGAPGGRFDEPGRLVWLASPRVESGMALTCGDMDGDGDLDVFLGQYKMPDLGQILKPSYHNALDSYPAFLLRNDGQGNFSDVTGSARLESKRLRRIFSASLVDLNDDGHLDLVTVSDFAGLDLFQNDGKERFIDVTKEWAAETHAFGMAHALADFNADGRLDLLMIGMTSPTVDRLEHLGLRRPGLIEQPDTRARMTYGNRLYLARAQGGFEQTALSDSIARSGWSWGCSAFDFDNDGFPDAYVANGHQSKQSVRDYEPEFWLHDLFIDESVEEAAATGYFTGKFARTRGRGWSYAGSEKNRLFLNREGRSFLESAHLMGVALEQDSRNVVANDLDGDGRVDLLVTTDEVWPEVRQTLHVFKNTLASGGNWIGFRFDAKASTISPVGARVTLHYDGRSAVRQIVNGDSLRSQHANVLHFGLGAVAQVQRAEIRWPGGQSLALNEPALNRYHTIQAPVKDRVR